MKLLGLLALSAIQAQDDADQYNADEYVYYETSSDWSLTSALKNLLSGSDQYSNYEGSAQVLNWWDTFNDDNYDLDKASDIMTRYPLDIEITDDYDSTLDHYISLFVVAIAAIILALLACTAYGRFITAKTRHDRVPSSEETKSLL